MDTQIRCTTKSKNTLIGWLFLVTFMGRWLSLPNPLPPTWTPDLKVRFTAPIIEEVEHSDTKTIIRSGVWYIPVAGYAEIIPGDLVRFTGRVEPKVLLAKTIQIVMKDPTFEVVVPRRERRLGVIERVRIGLLTARQKMVQILQMQLPEPMSSLAAGILLGVKASLPQAFYRDLAATGTLHVVAASGYNVMIVAGVVMKMASRVCGRQLAVAAGLLGVGTYVILAGAGPAVLRAGIMAGLSLSAYYFGRVATARRLLWVSAALMLLVQPRLLFEIGFQLSVAATAGLLYWEEGIARAGGRRSEGQGIRRYLADYVYPTLAASAATLPLILWHFGEVSYLSPVVNALVLPAVPVIMLLSAVTVALGLMAPGLGRVAALFSYVPLAWMVGVIRWFGGGG